MEWQVGTVVENSWITERIRSVKIKLEKPVQFLAGQHYDFRLTAPDGYQAQRSYSIASAPEQHETLEFGVEVLPDGEVSSYIDGMATGDQLEVRGPLGGHFVWRSTDESPLLLIGGGSGFVPLMSMIRHYINGSSAQQLVAVMSARTPSDLLWLPELQQYSQDNRNFSLHLALTREWPQDWEQHRGRLDRNFLKQLLAQFPRDLPKIYLCGRSAFVEQISEHLIALDFMPGDIKTERYG